MKKFSYSLCALTISFMLVGCGGSSSDSSPISNKPTNNTPTNPTTPPNPLVPIQNGVFSYTLFDAYSAPYETGWGRIDHTFRKGYYEEVASTVVGDIPYEDRNTPGGYTNYDVSFMFGKGFVNIIPDKDVQILGSTIKIIDQDSFTIKYPNGNLTEQYDIVAYDLSGKGRNAADTKQGLFTDLDTYASYFTQTNYQFPQGSICYVMNNKSNLPFYSSYGMAPHDNNTLQEWIEKEKQSLLGLNGKYVPMQVNNVVYENIGINNSIPAVRYTDQIGEYHAAFIYDGVRYDASYSDGVKYMNYSNIDSKNGAVECYHYNKVAADYLAQQMKLSYK